MISSHRSVTASGSKTGADTLPSWRAFGVAPVTDGSWSTYANNPLLQFHLTMMLITLHGLKNDSFSLTMFLIRCSHTR